MLGSENPPFPTSNDGEQMPLNDAMTGERHGPGMPMSPNSQKSVDKSMSLRDTPGAFFNPNNSNEPEPTNGFSGSETPEGNGPPINPGGASEEVESFKEMISGGAPLEESYGRARGDNGGKAA